MVAGVVTVVRVGVALLEETADREEQAEEGRVER
jgi:hypothetical protein